MCIIVEVKFFIYNNMQTNNQYFYIFDFSTLWWFYIGLGFRVCWRNSAPQPMILSRFYRLIGHRGDENNPLSSSEESWAMHICVTQRISGDEEDYGSCKVIIWINKKEIKFMEKSWPIHVPAAAVIHEWQALSDIIRCKVY